MFNLLVEFLLEIWYTERNDGGSIIISTDYRYVCWWVNVGIAVTGAASSLITIKSDGGAPDISLGKLR